MEGTTQDDDVVDNNGFTLRFVEGTTQDDDVGDNNGSMRVQVDITGLLLTAILETVIQFCPFTMDTRKVFAKICLSSGIK